MKTELSPTLLETEEGKQADAILRSCVHCGFCNASCPTYQLLGDESDGPRGRIYLIKQLLEGKEVTQSTQLHLDRCLTCRNCETSCPSGVKYSHLLDIGRKHIEKKALRSFKERLTRQLLLNILPYKKRFTPLLKTAQMFEPLIPRTLRKKIPGRIAKGSIPTNLHQRRMLILDGCVQAALSPDINTATARVLDKFGISVVQSTKAGCCGAVSQHLSAEHDARVFMKRNIDAWWPEIESGAEAIVMTASGCGLMVKEYAHHLNDDPDYAQKAQRVSELCKDISEIIIEEDYLKHINISEGKNKISFHSPCTLQHGQKINGLVEKILDDCGYKLLTVIDSHFCCGSAGTYSILQPQISAKLQQNKMANLQAHKPEMIVTANIGCQTHLQETSDVPVIHWIHLLNS